MAGPATKHATMPNVAFTRWDPLHDLLALHEQLGQLVGSRRARLDAAGRPATRPPTDYVLSAELPGLTRDQIEIHAEENRIVIRGERAAAARCRASSSTASNAATAASRARSSLPEPVDVDGDHGRPQGRRADGRRSRRPSRRGVARVNVVT